MHRFKYARVVHRHEFETPPFGNANAIHNHGKAMTRTRFLYRVPHRARLDEHDRDGRDGRAIGNRIGTLNCIRLLRFNQSLTVLDANCP